MSVNALDALRLVAATLFPLDSPKTILNRSYKKMYHQGSMRKRMVLLVLGVLALAVLACNPVSDQPTSKPATEESQPTRTPRPTQVEATEAPKPSAEGINANNVENLREIRTIIASERALNAAALSPVTLQAATFGNDRYVRVWDAENGDMTYELGPHAAEGWGLAYSPDGTRLASGGGFEVILWDPATCKMIKSITVNAYVFRLNWSPDGHYLAVVGGSSSKIDIVDAEVGSVKTRISTPAGKVLWAAAYSPDGAWMAVGDYAGNITILDADSSAIVAEDAATAKGSTWDLEFSPDGKQLASCNGSGDIYFWDTDNWTAIPDLIKRDVHADPNPALSGCSDGVFSKSGCVFLCRGQQGPQCLGYHQRQAAAIADFQRSCRYGFAVGRW
jgi:WD40 repeat protein